MKWKCNAPRTDRPQREESGTSGRQGVTQLHSSDDLEPILRGVCAPSPALQKSKAGGKALYWNPTLTATSTDSKPDLCRILVMLKQIFVSTSVGLSSGFSNYKKLSVTT